MSLLQSFDTEKTINSGQEFLWQRIGNSWYGIHGKSIIRFQAGESLKLESFPSDVSAQTVFRLDDDIEAIINNISQDTFVKDLLKRYPGLRLMRQDPEQCLFSFLCASNTSIPMIRRMLFSLCSRFGSPVQFNGHRFYTFPSADLLDKASEAELRALGLGYRARAIKAAAREITAGRLNLESLKKGSYQDARERLLQVYGIGPKTADCILLFSLDKTEAFPIDVWIARALGNHYRWIHGIKPVAKLSPHQYEDLSGKIRLYFGKYAGYAQQYIYYHMRQVAGRRW